MEDFEKLGTFYLGRPYDLNNKKGQAGLFLYDSKDLVTHAVCVGMTGSGKTGLCLALLEEAAIDKIPAIVIDPKGDLPNLLLTFPELKPEDFAPWVNEEDARKKGLSINEYAAQQADLWKKGLAEWGQDGARIKRFKESAECLIYTPGSNAGLPVSVLKSFAAPPATVREDSELIRERISSTTSSILGLLGIDADPIKSREHILISRIFEEDWSKGNDLDIAGLITQIQSPPMLKVGVFDLESFFPAKERFQLAMALNNLLAAPGFSSWMEGEPLDLQSLLYTANGKPRIAIFSIAHLNDAERMFFVSLLLNQTLSWIRTQSGTTSLRAILYMDEIFGYFPPVANPPSKLPLLTLLKQGRAFGLGVVLATQNPVDLDYKGLSNTGTWFIGRLQTERDKARVLEGLEGVSAGSGLKFDRQETEETLAGLSNRIFLLHNVHENGPEVFESRWALSYLRGPLTRTQIKVLMDPFKLKGEGSGSSALQSETKTSGTVNGGVQRATSTADISHSAQQPLLPPGINQYFLPIRTQPSPDAQLVYQPVVMGSAQVIFKNRSADTEHRVVLLASILEGPLTLDWNAATPMEVSLSDLENVGDEGAKFLSLPTAATNAKNYEKWKKEFASWLYRTQKIELFRSEKLDQSSNPGESERDFRLRLQQRTREERDQAVNRLREKYASKIAALEEKKRRAQSGVEREAEQAKGQKVQTAISFGATLLSSFLGRKSISLTTLGRATTAARGVSRSIKESEDVKRAEENLSAIDQQLADLDTQLKEEIKGLEETAETQYGELQTVTLKPTKADITLQLFSLVWAPNWQDKERLIPAW